MKYPIGIYEAPDEISPEMLESWICDIEAFPHRLRAAVQNLDSEQLAWPYRPDGWMIKQVIHHCADSHMNAWMRFKLALTEDTPAIRPYNEALWAEGADSIDDNIEPALTLLQGLHAKFGKLFRSMTEDELQREFFHPENETSFALVETIGNYAWHSNHHLAHVHQAIQHEGNFSRSEKQ
ncbi:MAG: YfiT family bacillithiol transferase [Bacteroidia bacterium]